MLRYLLVRILWLFVVLFIVLSLIFIISRLVHLVYWVPSSVPFSQKVTQTLGDYVQHFQNIFFSWDWGTAETGEPVWDLVRKAAPVTVRVNVITLIFSLILGTFFGVITALKRNKAIDFIVSNILSIYSSIPAFVWLFPLMLIFGWGLGWLPPVYPAFGTWPLSTRILAYVLPTAALAGIPVASITQILRNELIEILDSEHIKLAKSKGLRRYQILLRHTLRNSALPVVQKLPELFSVMLFNSFLVENIYYINGISRLFYQSVLMPVMDAYTFNFDVPMVVGIAAFYAIIKLGSDIVVDTAHVLIDPRISIGYKK